MKVVEYLEKIQSEPKLEKRYLTRLCVILSDKWFERQGSRPEKSPEQTSEGEKMTNDYPEWFLENWIDYAIDGTLQYMNEDLYDQFPDDETLPFK